MSDMMGFERMTHSVVPLPHPNVHKGHPFNNKKIHDKLLRYLQQRLPSARRPATRICRVWSAPIRRWPAGFDSDARTRFVSASRRRKGIRS